MVPAPIGADAESSERPLIMLERESAMEEYYQNWKLFGLLTIGTAGAVGIGMSSPGVPTPLVWLFGVTLVLMVITTLLQAFVPFLRLTEDAMIIHKSGSMLTREHIPREDIEQLRHLPTSDRRSYEYFEIVTEEGSERIRADQFQSDDRERFPQQFRRWAGLDEKD